MDEQYVGGQPYYLDLLYTEKYGYLNKDSDPNFDNEPIILSESLFQVEKTSRNYHRITLCSDYKIIGNIATHLDVLRPIKTSKAKA